MTEGYSWMLDMPDNAPLATAQARRLLEEVASLRTEAGHFRQECEALEALILVEQARSTALHEQLQIRDESIAVMRRDFDAQAAELRAMRDGEGTQSQTLESLRGELEESARLLRLCRSGRSRADKAVEAMREQYATLIQAAG
jgi:galactokinase